MSTPVVKSVHGPRLTPVGGDFDQAELGPDVAEEPLVVPIGSPGRSRPASATLLPCRCRR